MRVEWTAFIAYIRTHPQLGDMTYTVVQRDAGGDLVVEKNYLVVWPAIPDRLGDDRWTAKQAATSDRFLSFDVRVVAVDAEGLMLLIEWLTEHLIGHTLNVPGRRCEPITLATDGVEEGTVREDPKTLLQYLDLSFEFWSRRPKQEVRP